MNTLTALTDADVTLDKATDAPARYAAALTAMVAEGWQDRLPLDVKGRPSGDVKVAKDEIQAAYKAAGVTGGPALRNRVLRLTYALHILAAPGNARRDGEDDEAYTKRCLVIRAIGNRGDRDEIDKAIAVVAVKGSRKPSKGTRGPGKVQGGKGGKGKGDAPAPTPVSPAKAYEAAQNALVAAASAYLDALAAYQKDGGKVTKASAQAVTHRMNAVAAALSA